MPNWRQILTEINDQTLQYRAKSHSSADIVRRKYLKKLHERTGRNVIAYYSGWLSKPNIAGTDIIDEDKNGLMMAIHQLDKDAGLDLILHTPGGYIAAAESIIDYIKRIFGKNVRAVVPQIAMSAGTMIACACSKIVMGKHSNLGPVDPQLNGIPAAGVIEEFKTAYAEIKADPDKRAVWEHILRQYTPSYLGRCENAVKWAQSFVQAELENNMLSAHVDKQQRAEKIVKALTDFSGNKAHDRHIHIDELQDMGLDIELLEKDPMLQDLVLTVHHCYMNALMNTPAFKIIENHKGAAFVKQQQVVQIERA